MIVGSGTVAAIALSGYAGAATADADDDGRTSLPSDLESVLELVPGESALDANYQHVVYVDIDDPDDESALLGFHGVADEIDDIDSESVSEGIFAMSDDATVVALTGSFDRPDRGDERSDGWTVGEIDDDPFAAADGKLVAADSDDEADVIETAIAAASGDEPSIVTDPEATETTFEYLGSQSHVTFLPDISGTPSPELGDDVIDSVGIGRELPPTERADDGTLENGYVFHLADADITADDEWVLERIERLEQGNVLETTIDRADDGSVVYVDVVAEQPPERDRDAAPDARIRARSNADEGTVTVEHTDGESIDADMLEVWKNGDLADDQLADEYATFTEGDTFELETGPLADVGLRWFDEEADVYYYYDTTVVGSESFETTHDIDTDTVEITYVGDLNADPDLVELGRRNDDAVGTERSSLDISGSLSAGDTITAEDVTLGDRITLELAVPANPNRGQRSLVYFRVRPPRMHLSDRDGSVVARYFGDVERDADEFRVLVEDEPADVQFTDVTDTLSENEEIDLGEIEFGTHVAVEWLEPDEPEVIEERVVRPNARVGLVYDDAEGTVTVDYEERDDDVEGDAIDADDLELRVTGEPAATQPADEYDTFEPGDGFTIDIKPVAEVELVWEGPEDTEHTIGRTTVGRESFDAEYDPDAEVVEVVYTGQQPADPSNLTINHRGNDPTSDDEALFDQEYDALTDGDSVVIEDVGYEDRISVRLVQEGENYVSRRSIFHFRAEPRWAFRVTEQDDELVAVYGEEVTRDADNFRLLVDDELAAVQPADHHDTLTRDDEFELGEFEVGTELTFEWVVPDEPREVREHVVVPDAEFDIDYEEDDGEITIEHAGGDPIDADDLGLIVEPTMREPVGWDDQDTVTEGDATTVTADGEIETDRDPVAVRLVFQETDTIASERLKD
ncbi:hypothetical protein C446_17604 [Halobiforma nitratireducens JCM 10879]|uniref:Uncharacterized protein n=2 Tax=Halobiforma nitratireducens TaxID=130048 RepID=M0L813_9EURY|nr:hypothetical protein C446_17604 [Halobiforma nitratireducens JCM 10879]